MKNKRWNKYFAFVLSILLAFTLILPSNIAAQENSNTEGSVTISVEKFTLGQGYFTEPITIPLYEGETVGHIVARVLGSGNYNKGKDSESIVYLANIRDNDSSPVTIPQYILDEAGTIEPKQDPEWLGEFDYTWMSGWMYLVDNEMAPVGMSQYDPEDGDVIRLQFSVHGWGADIGFGWDGSYIDAADKDALTAKVAEVNSHPDKAALLSNTMVSKAYQHAYDVLEDMESSQISVNQTLEDLHTALVLSAVDKSELTSALTTANENIESVKISEDGAQVHPSDNWVTQAAHSAYAQAIEVAKAVEVNQQAFQPEVNSTLQALTTATNTFNTAKKSGTKAEANTFTLADIETAINKAVAQILSAGVNSEWEAIGIARSGEKVPISYYEDYFLTNIENQIKSASRKKITDIERLSIASSALGIEATDVDGINLVEQIYNSADWPSGADSMTAQGINGPIFALIALDSHDYEVPGDARWTREKLVDYILQKQNPDGSWSLFGTSPSYDLTAMALIALAPHQEGEKVQAAIELAGTFLSEKQGESGGYDDPWNGGVSSETTSQMIIALSSLGMDPTSEGFTKKANNLITNLMTFQHEDGGFKHLVKDTYSNGMATEQALQALIAYKLFLKDEGRLYQFKKEIQETIEVTPVIENGTTTLNVENVTQLADQGKVVVQLSTDTVKVQIPTALLNVLLEKNASIELVADEVKLVVPVTVFAKDADGSIVINKLADDEKSYSNVYDFSLVQFDKKMESFKENPVTMSFKLTKAQDDERLAIFYQDEEAKQWMKLGGEQQGAYFTGKTEHFSAFAVYAEDEWTEENEKEEENPTTPPSSEETEEEKEEENPAASNEKEEEQNAGNKQENNKTGNKLPLTATTVFQFIWIGLLMVLLGTGVFFYYRKKQLVH